MRIAFFSDVLIPPIGGIEQYILGVSQALVKRGHEVKVFAPEPLIAKSKIKDQKSKLSPKDQIKEFKKEHEVPGLEFRFISGLPAPALWENLRLAFPLNLYFDLKKWQPDVIHFQTVGSLSEAAAILAKLLRNGQSKKGENRPKLIGTFHSYLMEPEYLKRFNFAKGLEKTVSGVLWGLTRLLYNQADVVIAPSSWVGEDLARHRFTRPIRVIHNGADLSEFGKEASNEVIKKLREKYGLGENVLLYVGRLSEEKGLDVLIKSVQISNFQFSPPTADPPLAEIFNLKLLLVGDGPAEKELKKLAGDLGILDKVIFVGRVNHQDLAGSGLFEVSKAFVTASASENQPLTILEAMAKGLPIIGVNARGVTELVKGNGLLAVPGDEKDLANKIQQLINDEYARLKMSEVSRKMSQDYSLTMAAENLENLYRSI